MISRDEFVLTLENIENAMEEAGQFAEVIKADYSEIHCKLISHMINLLAEVMEDKKEDIEFFVYQCDFGKSHRHMLPNVSNAYDLYDYLIDNKEINEKQSQQEITYPNGCVIEIVHSIFKNNYMLTKIDYDNHMWVLVSLDGKEIWDNPKEFGGNFLNHTLTEKDIKCMIDYDNHLATFRKVADSIKEYYGGLNDN